MALNYREIKTASFIKYLEEYALIYPIRYFEDEKKLIIGFVKDDNIAFSYKLFKNDSADLINNIKTNLLDRNKKNEKQ